MQRKRTGGEDKIEWKTGELIAIGVGGAGWGWGEGLSIAVDRSWGG